MEERKQDEDAAGQDRRPRTTPVLERGEMKEATSGTGSGPEDEPNSCR